MANPVLQLLTFGDCAISGTSLAPGRRCGALAIAAGIGVPVEVPLETGAGARVPEVAAVVAADTADSGAGIGVPVEVPLETGAGARVPEVAAVVASDTADSA